MAEPLTPYNFGFLWVISIPDILDREIIICKLRTNIIVQIAYPIIMQISNGLIQLLASQRSLFYELLC